LVAIVDVNDGAVRFEHPPDDPGNERSVHPVKRRRERDDIKRPEISGQVFGAALNPPGVHHASLRRKPLCLSNHSCVGVESNNLLETVSKRKRHRARPTADVEKPASTVEPERLLERIGELRSVRETSAVIVGGSSGEQRLVPLPLSPSSLLIDRTWTSSATNPPHH
jgi:hypothetical protein